MNNTHNGAHGKPMVIEQEKASVAPAVTPEIAEAYRTAILAALPGLTGGIDVALRDQMGHPVAFVLFTFGPGGSAFTSNISDTAAMQAAVSGIVVSWADGGVSDEPQPPAQDDAYTPHNGG